jgi:hypothetical protein
MDYHVIMHEVDELVMQVIDGQLVIVPPKIAPQTQNSAEIEGHRKLDEE